MPTVMPEGELVRKAVQWILEMRKDDERSTAALIDEAAMRFNLGPKDCEALKRTLANDDDPVC